MIRKVVIGAALAVGSLEALNAVDANQTTQPEQSIDIGTLPGQLPPAVLGAAKAALSLEYSYSTYSMANKDLEEVTHASAVRVDPNIYLSAGHVVNNGENKPNPYVNVCGNLILNGPSKAATSTIGMLPNGTLNTIFGSTLEAIKQYGTFIKGDESSTTDISIIDAPDAGHTLPSQPVVKIAPQKPKVGEDVYFINYQPIYYPSGQPAAFRSPSEAETMNEDNILTPPPEELMQPAIYGGVISVIEPNGDLEIITGEKSYDDLNDKIVQKGSSGGEVVNDKGQMIGQVIQVMWANDYDKSVSESEFNTAFNIHAYGLGAYTVLSMANVQPVTSEEIKKLKAKLDAAKACVNEPDHMQTNF